MDTKSYRVLKELTEKLPINRGIEEQKKLFTVEIKFELILWLAKGF